MQAEEALTVAQRELGSAEKAKGYWSAKLEKQTEKLSHSFNTCDWSTHLRVSY